MLRLTGPGPRIVELCDGTRNLEGVIATLQAEFSGADPEMIRREVVAFLTVAAGKKGAGLGMSDLV